MSQSPDALELAALLCSRVCHDVVNPVGAIINGLEVLDDGDDPELREVAFDLIRKSADQASAKLQFSRMAFGAASSSGATIDLGDAEYVARQFMDPAKVRLEWNLPQMSVPKDQAKLILNLMLTAIATIPRGGAVQIDAETEGAKLVCLTVRASGSNARIPDEVERFVAGRGKWSEVTSHGIQPYYTGLIAKSVGMFVSFDWTNDIISIIAREAEAASDREFLETAAAGSVEPTDSIVSFASNPARSY